MSLCALRPSTYFFSRALCPSLDSERKDIEKMRRTVADVGVRRKHQSVPAPSRHHKHHKYPKSSYCKILNQHESTLYSQHSRILSYFHVLHTLHWPKWSSIWSWYHDTSESKQMQRNNCTTSFQARQSHPFNQSTLNSLSAHSHANLCAFAAGM